MTNTTQPKNSARRSFLKTSGAFSGGLMVGFALPMGGPAQAAGLMHTPSAWVHIADDNTITLISARAEMGQGVYTSMPMLIAEELNVDIQKVKVAFAPPGKVYGNALIFGLQLTGGSTSVREGYDKLRLAGAQVREMLVAAAAAKWNVDASTLKADNGYVTGAKGKKASYGQLAEAASKLPVPEKPAMEDHTAGHAGQGQWHGALLHRRQVAGHGVRLARTITGAGWQGQEL
jgi:isoquinoline 1-oxidoreductase beta subunit